MRFLKIIVASAAFLAAVPALAQVQVLGFELGTTTLRQVKAKLGQHTRTEDLGRNPFTGGKQFKTDGAGFEIDTLTGVLFVFDKEEKLVALVMDLGKSRFDDIFDTFAAKYKLVLQHRPFVGDMYARFKSKGYVMELEAPHMGFEMSASYMREDLYHLVLGETSKQAQQKKAAEKSKF